MPICSPWVQGAPNREVVLPNVSPKHDAVWVRQLAAELKLKGHPAKRLLAQVGLDERNLNAGGARIGRAVD